MSDQQELSLTIIRFCAVECKMQMSGEESVWWMAEAWAWALDTSATNFTVTPGRIRTLGALVEPRKNVNGFRRQAVGIGGEWKTDWESVPRQIDNLCRRSERLTAAEWFKEYETVHPFIDGNGRTGQILYNWLAGSLREPEWAPNFWDDPRRFEGYGAPIN